jgi:hypothetical protein
MIISEENEWIANRWRILAGVLLVFTFTSFIIKLLPLPVKLVPLPDQLFLIFLALILMFQKRRVCRLFLIDWAPFILFLVLYDMMRSFAPMLYGRVHIAEPVQWELNTFAWFTNGEIPAFMLQDWVEAHLTESWKRACDFVLGTLYAFHFFAPMLVMWFFWRHLKERRLFYRFIYTFTVLNYLALMTFYLYPSAPPWYYQEFGLTQPEHTQYGQAAAGLSAIDRALRFKLFGTVWATFNANYFAAIPSLHGTWPTTVVIYLMAKYGKWMSLAVMYPILIWIGGAYFNHHYFVDYVIGHAYLLVAWLISEYVLIPKFFDRRINYSLLNKAF